MKSFSSVFKSFLFAVLFAVMAVSCNQSSVEQPVSPYEVEALKAVQAKSAKSTGKARVAYQTTDLNGEWVVVYIGKGGHLWHGGNWPCLQNLRYYGNNANWQVKNFSCPGSNVYDMQGEFSAPGSMAFETWDSFAGLPQSWVVDPSNDMVQLYRAGSNNPVWYKNYKLSQDPSGTYRYLTHQDEPGKTYVEVCMKRP